MTVARVNEQRMRLDDVSHVTGCQCNPFSTPIPVQAACCRHYNWRGTRLFNVEHLFWTESLLSQLLVLERGGGRYALRTNGGFRGGGHLPYRPDETV